MRALLDVNVLIALLDSGHVHHRVAMDWLPTHIEQGWASCPVTQNGCLRILSTESYPRARPVVAVAARLREAVDTPFHEFWADDLSILDASRFDSSRWLSARQITDAYLLALAVRHGGRLVTLDRNIDRGLVAGADARHLVVI